MHHEGELAVQRRAGWNVARWGSARVGPSIPPKAAEFLAQQPMVVIGAATDDGAVWAGLVAGSPGFVTAVGDRTVVSTRLPNEDDPLAGALGTERDIGMLAIEPETRRRMRVNGRARVSDGRLVVHTEQVYANCPKYIQARHPVLADTADAAGAKRGRSLTAAQRRWIAEADTFFVATGAAGHGADASHRGGNPGFVAVSGPARLSWPEYAGNSMYMTLGNLELDPRCGLLFVDWERGHTLQLSGHAHVDWDAGRAAAVPGAQRLVDFDVEQVVQIDGGSPLRWAFDEYSRVNPVVPVVAG